MIKENVRKILQEIPEDVILLAATKGRSVDEIIEAINSGISVIGENYIQEAITKFEKIGKIVKWHFIGHLQRNKVKKACRIFDMIETVDSDSIAREIDRRCGAMGKIMPVLIEINSGRENNKSGILPEDAKILASKIVNMKNIRLMGIMTMGPNVENSEDIRPYFRLTKGIYDEMKDEFGNEIKYLSMGMSSTYKIAIEEGANIVRIGTAIFGERKN